MTKNISSFLKLTAAGALLLSVGACKAADKGQAALKSEGFAALNLSKSDSSTFAKYFETESCEAEEMESLGALAGLGLGEDSQDGISFKAREVNDGKVIYRDLTLTDGDKDDVSFSAQTAVFHCPNMSEDAPTFERLDLTDITILDQKKGVEFKAKTVNIADPSAEASRSIVESMMKADASQRSNVSFGAFSITEATISSEELNGSIGSLTWGESRDESQKGTADLSLDDVNFKLPGKNGASEMTLDFEGMSIRNMSVQKKANPNQTKTPDDILRHAFSNLNFFEKPYDEFIIEKLTFNSDAVDVNFEGIEGKTNEKSGVITTKQSLKPMVINLKPALGDDPAFRRNYEIIKSLNFETIEISGSSVTQLNSNDDSLSVSDGLLSIKDALRLNFEYEAEGLTAVTEKMEAMSASGSKADPMQALDAIKLRGLRLTLEDESIVSRGLLLASEMTGQSETSLKCMLTGLVFAAPLAAENDLQAEVYAESAEAFVNFVKNGGTLTIAANPPAPVSIAPLLSGKGADVDPKSLGFTASQENGAE